MSQLLPTPIKTNVQSVPSVLSVSANISGLTHVYGDNIDTDRIIPGKYTKTLDTSQLAAHVLEDLDPTFATRVQQGDILVAGENFGCGSSREQAPIAIKSAGISAVVAQSFARIFYRNAINIGLPLIEIGPHQIENNSILSINLAEGVVIDSASQTQYQAAKMPAVMMAILDAGGLVSYLKNGGSYDI